MVSELTIPSADGAARVAARLTGQAVAEADPAGGPPGAGPSGSSGRIDRRRFLRRAGLGLGTALVAGNAVVSYLAYDQGVMAEGRGPAFEPWRSWRTGPGAEPLVRAAILAASAHNTQPWLFTAAADRIELHADLTRRTGANDPLDRELDVSLGCALENLLLAAGANGFDPQLTDPAPDGTVAASVGLPAGPVRASDLHDAIPLRRSNRSVYRSDPIDTAVLRAMDALADASVHPARLVWLTGPGERSRLADLLTEAARAHAEDEEQSVASYRWWRGDWDDVQRQRDGLTIDGAGLRPVARTVGKLLPALTPTSDARRFNDRTFVDRTRQQATSAPAFGVVVVDDPAVRTERMAGGRMLQRLHLLATVRGLGFQHMNQITERIDRDRQLGRHPVFEPALSELAGPGVLGLFRIGVPTVPALASPRRPLSAVLR